MKRVSHIVNITAGAITTVHTVKTSQSRAAPVLLQFIVETLDILFHNLFVIMSRFCENSESFLHFDVSTVMILYWTCFTPFCFMEDFTSVTVVITSCSGYHHDVSQGCLHCMISRWMFPPCWNRVRFEQHQTTTSETVLCTDRTDIDHDERFY